MAKFLHLDPSFSIIFIQVILSLVSIIAFYKFIKILHNEKVALFASILISIIPIYWITNVSIMAETTYLTSFILSIFFLAKYLSLNSNYKIYLIFSALFFGFSFLTHKVIIIYFPLIPYIAFFLNRSKFKIVVCYFLISLLVFIIINSYFISLQQNNNLIKSTSLLLKDKLEDHPSDLSLTIRSIAIYLRNFLIPLIRNNTTIVVLLSFIALIKLLIKDIKIAFLYVIWILPAAVANQAWDSLLFGRLALSTSLGLCILAANIINKPITKLLIVLYILVISLPVIYLFRLPIPYIEEAKYVEILPKDSLLIESHFARPQVEILYKGKMLVVDEPGWKENIHKKIENNLNSNTPVYVTSQALSEPYGLYSGPYLHSLSLSYYKDFLLKDIIQKYTLKEYKVINNEDNLIIYKIISATPSAYLQIKNMKYSKRRLDYYDPISQIWFIVNRKMNLNI